MMSRLALFIFGLLMSITANAAEFSARVDREQLTATEHLELTLSLINSDTRLRAQGIDPNIDLSVLTKDFDVGTPTDSNRFNLYRGAGRSTSEIHVTLFPKHAGELMIPAFSVDGLATQAIAIQVATANDADAPEIFSRASLSATTVWQRQQVLVHLDVLSRVAMTEAKLGGDVESNPSSFNALEYRRLAVTQQEESKDGFTYRVLRTTWAFFPDVAGEWTLTTPDSWLITATGEQRRLPRETLKLTVRALPAEVDDKIMVGVPKVTLEQLQSQPHVNQLNSWQFVLRAPVSYRNVPGQPLFKPAPGMQMYADKPTSETVETATGIEQVARYVFAAFPLQQGVLQTPAVRFAYFDPDSGSIQYRDIDGPTLTITAAANTMPTKTELTTSVSTSKDNADATPWQMATVSVTVAWLLTLILWRQSRTPRQPKRSITINDKQHTDHRPLETALLRAFGTRSLAEGLQRWQSVHGVDHEMERIVSAVQLHYYGPTANNSTPNTALATEVQQLCETLCATTAYGYKTLNPWAPESFTGSIRGK